MCGSRRRVLSSTPQPEQPLQEEQKGGDVHTNLSILRTDGYFTRLPAGRPARGTALIPVAFYPWHAVQSIDGLSRAWGRNDWLLVYRLIRMQDRSARLFSDLTRQLLGRGFMFLGFPAVR
ncbi:hypothetical protein M407DRAFT_241416 [Tulasnella calospora MUT 4182]|uniref:Uncharacterized protein n=1 Tax=Tulasnella calospora MUT 4182 TaxID=1051891 RepID=A0A0C3QV98_9AGAM|nr:hypothetical protein M407DRAFT_241416 [Tulasnella calospora MUT 4182]